MASVSISGVTYFIPGASGHSRGREIPRVTPNAPIALRDRPYGPPDHIQQRPAFVALTDHTRPSIPDSPLPRCSHTPARRPKCTTGHRSERHAKTRWVRSQIGSSGHAAEILRVVWAGARGRADGRRNTHVSKTRPDKVPAPFRIQNIPSRPARAQHQWERRCVQASTPTGTAAGKAGDAESRGRGCCLRGASAGSLREQGRRRKVLRTRGSCRKGDCRNRRRWRSQPDRKALWPLWWPQP